MAAKRRCHTVADEGDDNKKVYKTKKVLFVDSHGVKNFPYRRRQKTFSCHKQILGSSTERHNDVFGMTIFQFEREFTACLERRKQNEPQILNILFPIKTDNRYLEYLKNTQSQQTDHTSLLSSQEKEVYDNLIRVVGSEMDIRIRQNMLLIKDKIYKKVYTDRTLVSSGSLAEGLNLTGSDIDLMYVLNYVQVIQNVKHMNRSARYTTLLMEDNMGFPGFCRLKLIAVGDHQYNCTSAECFVETINGMFLSSISFVRKCIGLAINYKQSEHGPCLSDKDGSEDIAFCFHLHSWPRQAEQWLFRHRPGQWPLDTLIEDIVNYGCIMVPIGPKVITNNELLWRISFSMAEKQLSHSMNYTQILCYALLKLSLKNIIDRNYKVKGLFCSYFMKTAVFWLSEEISTNAFQLQNLFHCYFLCLDKIISWVKCCYCPNYFIPEHNMFRGKINRSNSRQLLNVIERLRNGQRELFTVNTLFKSETVLSESSIKLELFLYKVFENDVDVDIEKRYTELSFIKSLAMSYSSSIVSGICKYYYAIASQYIVQKLPFPSTNISNVHVIRRYHKHSHDGTKSDAVTGWLLYASFYYVLGQYNTTLKIIDHVLSRCTPDMIMLHKINYTKDDIKYYKQNVGCSKITLNEKMRLATIGNVLYIKQSTLIPHELKPEVQDGIFFVPPVIMSHCLRCLCYHHLDDIVNRQQSLRDLYLTINEGYFVAANRLSESLTILGVCNDIVGDKETAYYCYDAALQLAEIKGAQYWRYPFISLCDPKQLSEYMIIEVEIVLDKDKPHRIPVSNKHVLADVCVQQLSNTGLSDQQYFCRTHLGHLLNPGDTVLGFNFANSNLNHAEFDKMKADKIPDMLVKKAFGDKNSRNKKRKWKLKHLHDDLHVETSSNERDYADFLEDLEEDPAYRKNVEIYKDASKIAVDENDTDDEGLPQISLQEMLDDLHISTDATGEDGADMMTE